MSIALYVMAGWAVLSTLLVVGSVGQPRKPISPGLATYVVTANAAWVVVPILAARRLS